MISHDAMMRFVSIKGGGALIPSGSGDMMTQTNDKKSTTGDSGGGAGLDLGSKDVNVKKEKPEVKTLKPPSNVDIKGGVKKQRTTFITPKLEHKAKSDKDPGNVKYIRASGGSDLLKELKMHKKKHNKGTFSRPPQIKSTSKAKVNITPSRQPQLLSKNKPMIAVSTNNPPTSLSKKVTVSKNAKIKPTMTVSQTNPPPNLSKVTLSSNGPLLDLSTRGPYQAVSTIGPHLALVTSGTRVLSTSVLHQALPICVATPELSTSDQPLNVSTSDPPPDLSTRDLPPNLSTSDHPPDLSTSDPPPNLSTSDPPPDLSTSGTLADLFTSNPHAVRSTSGPHSALSTSGPPGALSISGPHAALYISSQPSDLSTSDHPPDLSTSDHHPDLSASVPPTVLSTSSLPNMSTVKEDTAVRVSIIQPDSFVSTVKPSQTFSTNTEPIIATKSQPASALVNYNVKENNSVEENTRQKKQPKESKENLEKLRTVANIYKCDKCLKEFSYLKRLNTHKIRGYCDQKQFNCYQCESKFSSAKYLISHVKRVHTKPLFQCAHCLKMFPTKLTVDRHIKGKHALSECKLCPKVFKNKNTLASHVYNCHVKKSENEVVAVATDIADNESNQIEVKDKNMTEENILKIGQEKRSKSKTLTQTEEYQRKCSLCNKTYNSRSGYSRHMKTHRAANKIENTEDGIVVDESVLKEGLHTNVFVVQEDQEQEVGMTDF